MIEDERPEEQSTDETPPTDDTPPTDEGTEYPAEAATGEAPVEPAPDEPAAPEAATAPDEAAAPEDETPADVAAEKAPAPEEGRRRREKQEPEAKPEVVPGADLEPDLVLEERREDQPRDEPDPSRYGDDDESQETDVGGAPSEDTAAAGAPAEIAPIELSADARYRATGKRKTAVARVILKPGSGVYTVNGRTLEDAFPRPTLQKTARDPLRTTGNADRMDVVARIHGGGVAAQADALRHGIAKALVDADPNLRAELKRRGFLTRDSRVKERKKAGLKKARKRPQFSKR